MANVKMERNILIIVFSLVCLLSSGCAQAPITGRSQIMLVSSGQELALGLSAYREILEKERISRDPRLNAMLSQVGWRIARAARRPDYKWAFHLIDNDKMANAFCLPGGKVFVYTGILKYTRDEEGLAVVVGHEVAHALARHGAERMSMDLLAKIGGDVAGAALNIQSPQAMKAFSAAYGLAANVGLLLPYSRTQEFEADYIGLILMARACYNPGKALVFWQRMLRANKGRSRPVFLSTHPTDEARIQKLRQLIPQARRIFLSSCSGFY